MLAIWNDILAMLKAPFVGTLDLTHIFLLVGVVLIFAALWALILNHIATAAQEI